MSYPVEVPFNRLKTGEARQHRRDIERAFVASRANDLDTNREADPHAAGAQESKRTTELWDCLDCVEAANHAYGVKCDGCGVQFDRIAAAEYDALVKADAKAQALRKGGAETEVAAGEALAEVGKAIKAYAEAYKVEAGYKAPPLPPKDRSPAS